MGREGGAGEKHKGCATACINGGGPVGLLTDEDQLILLVGAEHADIKKMVGDLIAAKVKVAGLMSVRGGLRVLSATSVTADTTPARTIKKAAADAKDVWVCPMGCSKSDKPGKGAACGMDLVKQKT
jgi:Na+(H+)/acetate symporter ActP